MAAQSTVYVYVFKWWMPTRFFFLLLLLLLLLLLIPLFLNLKVKVFRKRLLLYRGLTLVYRWKASGNSAMKMMRNRIASQCRPVNRNFLLQGVLI